MKLKKFNKKIFTICTFLLLLLMIPSFFAAMADDEGTLGNGKVPLLFLNIYHVLSFPTLTLLGAFMSLFGLCLDCMFYAFLIERIVFLFRSKFDKRQESVKQQRLSKRA